MPIVDLVDVQGFVASLDARMELSQDGEGMECVRFDVALRHHASLCHEFGEAVREWDREVFAGRIAFDPEVDRAWREEGWRLFQRAESLRVRAGKDDLSSDLLEAQRVLAKVLLDLRLLLERWVTPTIAVGPAARLGLPLDGEAAERARSIIAMLPPLSAEWQPVDPEQQASYRRLQASGPGL